MNSSKFINYHTILPGILSALNTCRAKMTFLLVLYICLYDANAYSNISAYERIVNLTNYLNRISDGVSMDVEYTELPDTPRKVQKIAGVFLIPLTNQLAEIVVQRNIFWFDLTIAGPQMIKFNDQVITKFGWIVGTYPFLDSEGKLVGRAAYFCNQSQFALSVRTNGIDEANDWVQNSLEKNRGLADNFVRFSLPNVPISSMSIKPDDSTVCTSSGVVLFSVQTNSPSELELALGTASLHAPYTLVRYGYNDPTDSLPTTIDSFLCLPARQKIHLLTGKILEIRRLYKPIKNMPDEIAKISHSKRDFGYFEVTPSGESEKIGGKTFKVVEPSGMIGK